MTELLPCPFCGGEARIFHFSSAVRDEVWHAVCEKPFCTIGPDGYTEAEAIEAWNTRAERMCRFLPFRGPISDTDEIGDRKGVCSVCSAYMHEQYSYCPNCGAKVVD